MEPAVPTGGGRRVPFGGSPPDLVMSSGDGVHMGWRVPGATPPAMCIGGPASQNRAAAGPRRQPSQGWDTARCHVRRETGGAWVHQFRGGSARGRASIAGKPPGGGNLMCRSCWAARPRAHRRRATRRWKSYAPVVRGQGQASQCNEGRGAAEEKCAANRRTRAQANLWRRGTPPCRSTCGRRCGTGEWCASATGRTTFPQRRPCPRR